MPGGAYLPGVKVFFSGAGRPPAVLHVNHPHKTIRHILSGPGSGFKIPEPGFHVRIRGAPFYLISFEYCIIFKKGKGVRSLPLDRCMDQLPGSSIAGYRACIECSSSGWRDPGCRGSMNPGDSVPLSNIYINGARI